MYTEKDTAKIIKITKLMKTMKLTKNEGEKMKISTAEIKMLLKECARVEGIYTVLDFSEYIMRKSPKSFTKSQISGAITQLVDCGDIIRVERGLYRGKVQIKKDSAEVSAKQKEKEFEQDAAECLQRMEETLEEFGSSKNAWQLDAYRFEILTDMRELKDRMQWIREKCKR